MPAISLYLIRHGLAGQRGTYTDDTARPLTDDGKQKTHQVAIRLRELGLSFDLMLTSPYVRARQTAEILMNVGLAASLEEAQYLGHGGAIDEWLSWLNTWRSTGKTSLALVGHEPDLTTWAEHLLWGDSSDRSESGLTLKKAGVMGLTLPETGSPIGQSSLFWLTPPRLLLS